MLFINKILTTGLVLFSVGLFMHPIYSDYTGRAHISQAKSETKNYREILEQQIVSGDNSYRLKEKIISIDNNGTFFTVYPTQVKSLIFKKKESDTLMVLYPTIKKEQLTNKPTIQWQCLVVPIKDALTDCKLFRNEIK